MTMCNVKGVTHSEKPKDNDSAVTQLCWGVSILFWIFVSVFQQLPQLSQIQFLVASCSCFQPKASDKPTAQHRQ